MSEKSGSRTRRILKNALVSVLVLGAVGGGVAYTAVTAHGAPPSAPSLLYTYPSPRDGHQYRKPG